MVFYKIWIPRIHELLAFFSFSVSSLERSGIRKGMRMTTSMDVLQGFIFLFVVFLATAVWVQGHHETEFISIDCGIPDQGNPDEKTGINYSVDSNNIETGVNVNLSPYYLSETHDKRLYTVRSFPEGRKNCYTLRPEDGKNNKYLIRASFMYGNYDGSNKLPTFDLYLGVNHWDTLTFDNASHIQTKEIIHVAPADDIYVCLLDKGQGTPFISSLELRPLNDSIYETESGALVLIHRLDIGSISSEQKVRFPDDIYDRIWLPSSWSNVDPIKASSPVESEDNIYTPPSTVMRTAVQPKNGGDSLEYQLRVRDTTLRFRTYLYFAELEYQNQSRQFSIYFNGLLLEEVGSVVPRYLSSSTRSFTQTLSGPDIQISLRSSNESKLPPILNAIEFYLVKQLKQLPTNNEDFHVITDIKRTYKVKKIWQGDPCAPVGYAWDGLNCSYVGVNPPRIISLNLSGSGLTGEIDSSLRNLTSLQSLDLSYNDLGGSVPDFLSELPSLKFLNLAGNKLSGSVPTALIEKSKNGLLLSLEDNPKLCPSSCKKKKNIIVPVVASITSVLVILVVVVIFWSLKRSKQRDGLSGSKNHQHSIGSLESNNRRFTHSEVVRITKNFEKTLGKGGSGTVYHGHLEDYTQVAVKMLSPSSTEGFKEFRTEVQLLLRVHHRNLASFIGYCDEGTSKALIYEYMANGNLRNYLSGKNANALSWEDRLRIAIDAAQGLEYLHNGCKPPIIHRDVKTSNILLNERLQAKLADFGLSKDIPNEDGTHVSTTVIGTLGYLDPEYYNSNKLNEKSDVYGFGIVLLELITGRPALVGSDTMIHIVQWVGPLFVRGEIKGIVDQRLQGDYNINSIWKVLEIAMACTAPTSIQRPIMTNVLVELKESLEIQTANNMSWKVKEELETKSTASFGMSSLDLSAEIGPSAR
ncbi:PREDICTED: putative leucine-rich repeat receptor-like protein kinase At2g19210 isoform X2 [Nelumbo nucifera]|uniref:non-specific serine/threonine protein kinase n=1 Tax=Nelumbo nucifera TaxID=4432 RepID=A0A1U7YZM5_NELNU|nr:PREDICTED: putative leucine-rich repeat receptor-like protein kinase At2g19210 isoform X2 [Nelumbo nucifera]